MKRFVRILLACAAARTACGAGPFSTCDAGIVASSTVFRAWISRVVSSSHPAGSGGFANDESYPLPQPTTPDIAVSGRPEDFDYVGSQSPLAHVLSLGSGGSVIVTFAEPICDGPGADFAVFENGFIDRQVTEGTPREGDTNVYSFSELAYVEVGTTTNAWARFPCQSLITSEVYAFTLPNSDRFGSLDATRVDGLAGKHTIDFGTPFDLSALRTHTNVLNGSVDLSNVLYVRLVDVVGNGSCLDSSNRPVFDPYRNPLSLSDPSPASTDGFDLRAIGVINGGPLLPSAGGVLRWFGVSGQVYRVEHAAGLGGAWSTAGVHTGAMAWTACTNTASGFFRLIHWSAP